MRRIHNNFPFRGLYKDESHVHIFFPGLISQLKIWWQTFVSWSIRLHGVYFKNMKRMIQFSFMIHATRLHVAVLTFISQSGRPPDSQISSLYFSTVLKQHFHIHFMNVKIRTEKLILRLISVFWQWVNDCIFHDASLSLEMESFHGFSGAELMSFFHWCSYLFFSLCSFNISLII